MNQITSAAPNSNTGGTHLPDAPEDDGNLSIDVAMLILKIHAEAVGRSVQLGPPSELYVKADSCFFLTPV